jgi:outer membrane protein OmpA-like peptidoglycan-associated protein
MRRPWKVVAATCAGVLVVGAAGVAAKALVVTPESPPALTIVVTGGTVNETDVSITGAPAELIRASAEVDGQVDLVKVNGDGATTVESYDLTPRDGKGVELRPQKRRERAIDAKLTELAATMNRFDTSVDGRSVLAGLQNVPTGTGQILVYSPALDLNDPISFISLGFDVDAKSVVAQLKASGDLPVNLRGRDVTFILTPTAGIQQPLRQPQVLYRQRLFSAVALTAGASNVSFIVGEGGLSTGAGGQARVVPVPPPPSTIKAEKTAVTDKDGNTKVTTKCVIPSPMLFQPDSTELLDARAARTALANCIGHANASTLIRVDGHTACRNAPDSDAEFAKKLSRARASRIVDIAVQLGIRRSHTAAYGWGDRKPIKKPCSHPANRASVVSITTP